MSSGLICEKTNAENSPRAASILVTIPEQAQWNPSNDSSLRFEGSETNWQKTQTSDEPEPAFLERATKKPMFFFSEDNEAASQRKSAEILKTMINPESLVMAWNYCLRLRWLSPRIDIVAPICKKIGDTILKDASRLTSDPLKNLLPQKVHRLELMTSSSLGKITNDYLMQPYDPTRLSALIIALDNEGIRDLAGHLLTELYQLDSQCLWLRVAPGGLNRPLVEIARGTNG